MEKQVTGNGEHIPRAKRVAEGDALAGVGTAKVVNIPRACVRGLDVDGIYTCKGIALRPRGRVGEKMLCTWREACKAADYVLEHFGDKSRDRGIWIWYCRRIGLDVFLDIADEVISSARQGELRWPTRALQRHLQEALPKNPPSPKASAAALRAMADKSEDNPPSPKATEDRGGAI